MCKRCIDLLFDKTNTVQTTWQQQCKMWSLLEDLEIDYTYIYNDTDEIYSSNVLKKVKKCICSVRIERNFPIYNNERKICVVLGSRCIQQHKKKGEAEYGIFEDNKDLLKQFKVLNTHTCVTCMKSMDIKNVNAHNLTATHILNEKKRNYRQCRTCKDYNIQKTAPANYNYCKPCMTRYYTARRLADQ